MIFDFDGTIADTLGLAVQTYNKYSSKFKTKPIETTDIPALIKMGYFKAARAMRIKWRYVPNMILTVARGMKRQMKTVEPYPGIAKCIADLKERGYELGILTSNQQDIVQDFLNQHGFVELDFIVSERSLFAKHKALKKIMQARNLRPSEVIYVGDEPRDVSASRRAGVGSIGVSWGVAGSDGYGKNAPDFLVDTAEALESTILNDLRT